MYSKFNVTNDLKQLVHFLVEMYRVQIGEQLAEYRVAFVVYEIVLAHKLIDLYLALGLIIRAHTICVLSLQFLANLARFVVLVEFAHLFEHLAVIVYYVVLVEVFYVLYGADAELFETLFGKRLTRIEIPQRCSGFVSIRVELMDALQILG